MSDDSFTDNDSYQWVRHNGKWVIESTKENGQKVLLPEGEIPSRAPCRFRESPNYTEWNESIKKKKDEVDSEIAAR